VVGSELDRTQFSSSIDVHKARFGETVTIWQRSGYDHHQPSCKADRVVEGQNSNFHSFSIETERWIAATLGVAMKR
jgi:hypothetical protein